MSEGSLYKSGTPIHSTLSMEDQGLYEGVSKSFRTESITD
jgi:hypothetical protein